MVRAQVLSKSLPSMEGCNIKWSSPESESAHSTLAAASHRVAGNLTRKEVAEKKSKAKKGKKAKEEQKEVSFSLAPVLLLSHSPTPEVLVGAVF